MTIANNGGEDYWGNPVPYNSVTDRGANEYSSSGVMLPGVTNQAPVITVSNVTLNALVNPNGAATTWYYQYGLTTGYGSFGSTNTLTSGTSAVAVSNVLAGLLPGTLYHYQLVASNSAGVSSGADATFTTLAVAPTATTQPATSITASTATLNGSVNPGGAATACYFQYGLTTNYGSFSATNNLSAGNGAVAISNAVAGLPPGTLYHYRAVANNNAGSSAGTDLTFATLAVAPTVITQPATGITPSTAMLNGSVNPGGATTTWYFEYGTTTNYGTFSPTNTMVAGVNTLAVSNSTTGLVSGTRYHYRLVAGNSAGSDSGADVSFTTVTVPPPLLIAPVVLGDGSFQFTFTNPAGASFTVLATADMALPVINWAVLGAPTPIGGSLYQFSDSGATNYPQRFYLLRVP